MKLVVEVDTPTNANLYFPPIQREVRGKFDFARFREPMAMVELANFPTGVPGQRIELDTDAKVGKVTEPLHGEEHASMRQTLARRLTTGSINGTLGLPPREEAVQLKDPRDVPTWLYWMRRAVEGGHARLVQGKLPTDDQCKGARKQFVAPEPTTTADDLRKQELAAKLAMMTPEQRKEYERLLSGMGSKI